MSPRPDLWEVETGAQELASLMARSLPVTVVSVALRDEPSLSLAVKGVNSLRPVGRSVAVGDRVPLSSAPWHRAVFQRGEPVLVERNGDTNFQDEAELTLIPNLSAMYLVPIRFAEDTVGVLVLGEMRTSGRAPFSIEKQQRCRAILDEFVAATAHAWEARRLRRQVRVMSSLAHLARGVLGVRSFQELLVTVTSEMADWLGTPVHGALLRLTPGDIRLLARWQLPETALEDGGRQLVLAMTRAAGPEQWGVHVTPVAEDLLDPIGADNEKALAWTRVALPLMRGERLIGVACLYAEDELSLTDWEREALRRQGEIIALGVEALEATQSHEADNEWLHRVMFELRTGYRRALVGEVFGGLSRSLAAALPARLRNAVPILAQRIEASDLSTEDLTPDLAEVVVAEVSAAISGLWDGNGRWKPAKMVLDVNDVVARAVRFVRMSLESLASQRGTKVDVLFQPTAGLPAIEGSLTLVGAIAHAIESAAEAMPEGGEIHIRTERENNHVVITMEESAREPLIALDVIDRLSPNHPGLVLSVVRAIVHSHGGRVTFVPHEVRGNTLILHLPTGSTEGAD